MDNTEFENDFERMAYLIGQLAAVLISISTDKRLPFGMKESLKKKITSLTSKVNGVITKDECDHNWIKCLWGEEEQAIRICNNCWKREKVVNVSLQNGKQIKCAISYE